VGSERLDRLIHQVRPHTGRLADGRCARIVGHPSRPAHRPRPDGVRPGASPTAVAVRATVGGAVRGRGGGCAHVVDIGGVPRLSGPHCALHLQPQPVRTSRIPTSRRTTSRGGRGDREGKPRRWCCPASRSGCPARPAQRSPPVTFFTSTPDLTVVSPAWASRRWRPGQRVPPTRSCCSPPGALLGGPSINERLEGQAGGRRPLGRRR
jgi:hypothetical protein